MPIGGVVISTRPEERDAALSVLKSLAGLEIHGADEKGNIVGVLDTVTTDGMETLMKKIGAVEAVLHVGLTYLNSEDEAELMASGAYSPKIFGTRRNEKEFD